MSGDIQPYLDLITSEHASSPKFVAMISVIAQPFADGQQLLAGIPNDFDLDNAIGVQLDITGQWIGRTRQVREPITGVYFSFDTAGLGFDQGTWFGPFNPPDAVIQLPDDAYRTLLRATAVANQWNGSIPNAYDAWDILFAGTGFQVIIVDHDDMTMDLGLLGPAPDALTLALFSGGYMDLKPAGVLIANYLIPSVPSTPFFGFDLQNDSIAGFDTGCWATVLTPTP